MSDNTLGAACLCSARDFDRMYADHAPVICAIARQRGSAADAEDVMQDVFMRAWQHRRLFRGSATVRTWLTRIAINAVTDRDRSLLSHRRRLSDAADAVAPRRSESTVVVRLAVQAAIAKLPPRNQAIVIAHYVKGYGLRKISASLDMPVGTIKSVLYRARLRLRHRLDPPDD